MPDSTDDLSKQYDDCVSLAEKNNQQSSDFLDFAFPFVRKVITVGKANEVNHGQLPCRLNEIGEAFYAKKFKWRDTDPQHITLIMKDFMSKGGTDIKNTNSGIVSRLATITWATLVAPHPSLKGDDITPSANIKAHGGQNKLMAVWRKRKPQRSDDDIIRQDEKITVAEADERVARAVAKLRSTMERNADADVEWRVADALKVAKEAYDEQVKAAIGIANAVMAAFYSGGTPDITSIPRGAENTVIVGHIVDGKLNFKTVDHDDVRLAIENEEFGGNKPDKLTPRGEAVLAMITEKVSIKRADLIAVLKENGTISHGNALGPCLAALKNRGLLTEDADTNITLTKPEV